MSHFSLTLFGFYYLLKDPVMVEYLIFGKKNVFLAHSPRTENTMYSAS